MNQVIPISQARSTLPQIVEDVSVLARDAYISVGGKIKAVIVDAKNYSQMKATLEILSDKQAMKAIQSGLQDIENNDLIDWEELKQSLEL